MSESELTFKPSDDTRNALGTLQHLCGLSETILNAAKNQPSVRPVDWSQYSFSQLREMTLQNLKVASGLFQNKTAEEIAQLQVIFERNGNSNAFPFWNMINGPISDALYHTGQIVSFRRTFGNPINPKVNVFMGKNRE